MFKHSVRFNTAFVSMAFIGSITLYGATMNEARAQEVEPLDASLLISACKEYAEAASSKDLTGNFSGSDSGNVSSGNAQAIMCHSYLQGYFAATDDVVSIERIPSPLTIRAMKNRGVRISEEQKVWKAAYCISEMETLKDIAGKIANIDRASANNKTAQTLLREFLAEHYSCEKLKQEKSTQGAQ